MELAAVPWWETVPQQKEQPELPFRPPSVAYLTSVLGTKSSRFLLKQSHKAPEALRANQLRVHQTAVCADKAAHRRRAGRPRPFSAACLTGRILTWP